MGSIWSEKTGFKRHKALKGDAKTDVLIIGGGIAGILCAYMLDKEGVDYILAEANEICSGITKNTTAKITAQHSLIYNKIEKEFSTEYASLYYKANENALNNYRTLCAEIDCDFEEKDNYVYSTENDNKLKKEIETLHRINANAQYCDSVSIPVDITGAIKFPNQAQFNPLKFLSAISENLNIYEHTKIRELVGSTAVTDSGRIFAKRIVVATHFPFINKHGAYYLKMYQHRTYAIALEDEDDINGMYVDENKKGLSFRNYNNFLIIGGGSHRTGKNGGNWDELINFAKMNYPGSKITYKWATQDCMTLDGIPYVGRYSKNTNNLYVITGFNKWGMTNSMAGAELIRDLIIGRHNEFEDLYSPSRTLLRPQLAVNGFEAVINLVNPKPKRCPHLGCALRWNKEEQTWDCPCHGSRFEKNGDLIDNPATSGIKIN